MLRLATSSRAKEDLLDIWDYIADDQPMNADRFLDRLNETALSLAETPGMGADRPELSAGLKSFPVGNYLLYYRFGNEELELVRVLGRWRDRESFDW